MGLAFSMSSTKKFERLPKAIVPSHYDIWLKPDLNKFTFQGTITAHLEVSVNESFNSSLHLEDFLENDALQGRSILF